MRTDVRHLAFSIALTPTVSVVTWCGRELSAQEFQSRRDAPVCRTCSAVVADADESGGPTSHSVYNARAAR